MDDLDRWTRVMPLGSGAFGEVHLAWDGEDGRWVALKRFTGQDELGLLRMVIESRIRVSHPHLVRTLAFRLVDDRAWLVTEFARGGSLRALTTRVGVLPWGWVAEAVDQILAALAALHATGVVHRDLKPANLLLRSSGTEPPHLLVADFGIATWRTVSMTGIGAAIGTPGYLAPEYLDGHQPAPATDVFAVGVLAAELLTGRRMVHYSNASPTIPSSWHDVLPVPPEVPRAFAAVLQRMAAPNPAHRYTDSTQAREALLSALPPGTRGDLTAVPVPDLLAVLPPGWTEQGPETTLLATPEPPLPEPGSQPEPTPRPEPPPPNLTGLLIDGGPTGLVLENEATVSSGNTPLATPTPPPASASASSSPSDSATPPAIQATGSPAPPATHASGPPSFPATPAEGLSTPPPTGSPTPPTTHASGSPTFPNTPASGHSTPPPTSSPTPPTTDPSGPSTHPPTPSTTHPSGPSTPSTTHSTGPSASPTTSSTGPSTHRRTKSLTGSSTSPATTRKARRWRKVKRTFLLLVLLTFAAGAGTLWWAATHRTIPGQPSAIGSSPGEQTTAPWYPEVLEPCDRVELGQERKNGTERCQRTQNTNDPQHWVKAPATGFPTSNPKGPFPGEQCVNKGDPEYSPTGVHLTCDGDTWQVRTYG